LASAFASFALGGHVSLTALVAEVFMILEWEIVIQSLEGMVGKLLGKGNEGGGRKQKVQTSG
jgi:hypothetical protein